MSRCPPIPSASFGYGSQVEAVSQRPPLMVPCTLALDGGYGGTVVTRKRRGGPKQGPESCQLACQLGPAIREHGSVRSPHGSQEKMS